MLFTHSLEARNLRSKSQHSQVLMRGFLLSCTWPNFHFPGSSAGKESSCNAEDPSSIPRSGRSPGEGISYLLQYSCASLVAQLVKICLQCERPGFSPWVGKIPWWRERLPTPAFWPGEFHGLLAAKSWTQWSYFHFHFLSGVRDKAIL